MEPDPTERTLNLLALLLSRPQWRPGDLAVRLGTSARTLRRDVDRLRRLGYTVEVRPGPGSSYRLAPGVRVPPMVFTPDEVSVIVAGLRLVRARVDDDAAAGALAKLDQVLPAALARRASATELATDVVDDSEVPVAAASIGLVAEAVAENGRLRFGYLDQYGRPSARTVHPYRQVMRAGRWYLIGYDLDRADWRLFRLDRASDIERIPGIYRCEPFPFDTVREWLTTDFGRSSVERVTGQSQQRTE